MRFCKAIHLLDFLSDPDMQSVIFTEFHQSTGIIRKNLFSYRNFRTYSSVKICKYSNYSWSIEMVQ